MPKGRSMLIAMPASRSVSVPCNASPTTPATTVEETRMPVRGWSRTTATITMTAAT